MQEQTYNEQLLERFNIIAQAYFDQHQLEHEGNNPVSWSSIKCGVEAYFSQPNMDGLVTLKFKGFELGRHSSGKLFADFTASDNNVTVEQPVVMFSGFDIEKWLGYVDQLIAGQELDKVDRDYFAIKPGEPVIREVVREVASQQPDRPYTDADYYQAVAKAKLYDQIMASPAHSIKFGTEL